MDTQKKGDGMLSKTDWFHRKEQALIGFSKMSNKRRLETIWSMLETETMMDEEGKTYFLEVLDFYEKVVVGEREGVAKEIQKEVVSCFNGVQIASGTVSAGSNKSLALSYEDGTGGVTVVLTASSFNVVAFSGWTKDGVIVDRWSNPATIKAETSCTLSCAFGSTGALPQGQSSATATARFSMAMRAQQTPQPPLPSPPPTETAGTPLLGRFTKWARAKALNRHL